MIPGRWEKVEALAAGSSIIVTLKTGERYEVRYSSSSPTQLTVSDLDGSTRMLLKSDVDRITRPPEKDGNRNGILIGLAVGAAGGAATGATAAGGADWEKEAEAVGLGLIGAGVGALAGWIADDSIKSTEVLYRAM